MSVSEKVDVSFVVLTRNSSRTIGKCLECLTGFSRCRVEVVIVDGGSVDDTLVQVEKYAAVLDVVVLSDGGRGLGYARDIGWRNSRFKYVVMLDSDVVISEDFVEQAVSLLEWDARLGAVAAKLRPVIEYGGWSARFQAKNLAIHLHLNDDCYPAEAAALHTACTMFRRSALEVVGGFDHFFRLAKEDSDVSFKLRKAGYKLAYIPIEVTHLERSRFWKINFRYGRSYVHIAQKHPDMAPLTTVKNIILTASLLLPPLQLPVYIHYMRRYWMLKDLTRKEKAVLPFIETIRQAVRTSGMVYELLRRLICLG